MEKKKALTLTIPEPVLKLKGFISLLILITFIIVFISGLILQRYNIAGIKPSSPLWMKLHVLSSYTMTILVIIHFILNHKLFFAEIKRLFGMKGEKIKE